MAEDANAAGSPRRWWRLSMCGEGESRQARRAGLTKAEPYHE